MAGDWPRRAGRWASTIAALAAFRSRATRSHGRRQSRPTRCEALTRLPDTGAPDTLFDELTPHFTDEQIVALTLAIVAINGWNRLNVGFRTPVAAAKELATHRAG